MIHRHGRFRRHSDIHRPQQWIMPAARWWLATVPAPTPRLRTHLDKIQPGKIRQCGRLMLCQRRK
jgi:hypothetical protein